MKTITAVIIGAWWTGYWQFHDQKNEQSRRKTNVFKTQADKTPKSKGFPIFLQLFNLKSSVLAQK